MEMGNGAEGKVKEWDKCIRVHKNYIFVHKNDYRNMRTV